MSTTTNWRWTDPPDTQPTDRTSPVQRFFGVVTQSQSYRNLGYLVLGLPLGTIWFTVLISGLSVAFGMLIVALLGIPMLLGLWYVTRAFGNVERSAANVLLGEQIARAPMAAPHHGNLWVRLRSMTSERDRWRELGFLMLRLPVGLATFTVAVTALTTPVIVAYAPFCARYGGDQPFGDWALSSTTEDVASSPWSWFLVPIGVALLIAAFHLLNTLAEACGRWTTVWLGVEQTSRL
jgi:hypothetical protein